MWLTSASPGGFHDWKTLYQDRHRFYMWLHTYIVEANLVYCSPTVPLLEIKDNAADILTKPMKDAAQFRRLRRIVMNERD